MTSAAEAACVCSPVLSRVHRFILPIFDMQRLSSTCVLVGGRASTSPLLRTSVGLSFWGGVDPSTSLVVDRTHPLYGETLREKILAIPNGRGSCTGSQVVLELILNGIAPRAMILRQPDSIVALGAIVAKELFDMSIPIVSIGERRFDEMIERRETYASVDGDTVRFGSSEMDVRNDAENLRSKEIRRHEECSSDRLMLTEEEEDMCNGSDATAVAMRILTNAARIDGATSLIPISQAHIDGCTYIGPGGLQFAQRLADMGGRVRVPTTLNSNSVDRRRWRSLGVSPTLGTPAHALGDAYVQMGCSERSFTCAPYLLSTRPEYEEQIAWGESNAVVFANAVIGARTQKVADYLDICCAITGRVPRSGMHLDENRKGRVVLDASDVVSHLTSGDRTDNVDALYPLLGYVCGLRSETKVPVIVGLEHLNDVSRDDLKAFCAAFGSTASVPMFHMVGHTPEAPDLKTALGVDAAHDLYSNRVVLRPGDVEEAWNRLNDDDDTPSVQLVALGNPHLSLTECRDLAALCIDGYASSDVKVIATLGREVYAQAQAKGYVETMRRFGIEFINDTCWCMLTEPVVPVDGDALITNSAKYAHYAPGLVHKRVHFHGLEGCIEAARTGIVPSAPRWLTRK